MRRHTAGAARARACGQGAAARVLVVAAVLVAAGTAVAQQPTQAQQDAIRGACRSDFQRDCASVTPGGKAALECLQSHQQTLSAGCQGAVGAVGSPQASAPSSGSPSGSSGGTGTAEPSAPRPRLSPRQELAIMRQACGADYRRLCRGVPLGGGQAITCLGDHHASLSRTCQRTLDQAQSQR